MNNQTRRYVFVDFDTLTQIRFKKLEKVCDKVFVFVNEMVDDVPLMLVREMQRMGSNVKWISVAGTTVGDVNYHICFLMGKLHEKIAPELEFAILSNDPSFDPLVNFINSTGRSCLRVKPKNENEKAEKTVAKQQETHPPSIAPKLEDKIAIEPSSNGEIMGARAAMPEGSSKNLDIDVLTDSDQIIEETARETVRRLLRSGNRPSDISLLKNYILLHNQEIAIHHNIEKIIEKLEENHNISIEENEITYNF